MNPETHLSPTALLIFGAGGDLERRKLRPALFNLHACGSGGGGLVVADTSAGGLGGEPAGGLSQIDS